MVNHKDSRSFLAEGGFPILAILRGVNPSEVISVAEVLVAAGINRIEVPLNSPDAMESIELLIRELGESAFIGAGTVLRKEEVVDLGVIGCHFIVSPNFSAEVVLETKEKNMLSCPGVFTITEAFAALDAGADALKYFPANVGQPDAIIAWKQVLPPKVPFIATGGINARSFKTWIDAGASFVGVGQDLFSAGDTLEKVHSKTQLFTRHV